MKPVRVVVFAKAPLPGQVKTRLIPALGAAGAARLAHRLLEHALTQALAVGCSVELCMSPAPGAPEWAEVSLPPGVMLSDQGAGDLGARMARAARRVLAQGEAVLLAGTDCPALDASRLCAAAAALQTHDAALYPAADGGYVLLGLGCFDGRLFTDMPWSTAAVMALTRTRLAALGWRVWEGDTLRDVDEPMDLAALPPWGTALLTVSHGDAAGA